MSSSTVVAGVLVLAGLVSAIGVPRAAEQPTPLDPAALIAQLQATTDNWNKGDLEGFVAPYAAASTYMTAKGPVGRDSMLDHYRTRYFSSAAPRRPLRFEQVTVRALGADHALMTGRFVLGGDGKPDQSGWFTLVWLRTPDGWRILHDHSS